MARTLRRKLARHAAERLLAGDAAVIDELAALIIAERREREIDLLVQDIEAELAERGTVVATVESARALDAATKDEIKKLLASNSGVRASRRASGDARAAEQPSSDASSRVPETDASSQNINVLLRESIDPTLIGGFKLRTPTATLDATIAKKLNDLRAKKI
mgnify:CR=1 FL=1